MAKVTILRGFLNSCGGFLQDGKLNIFNPIAKELFMIEKEFIVVMLRLIHVTNEEKLHSVH